MPSLAVLLPLLDALLMLGAVLLLDPRPLLGGVLDAPALPAGAAPARLCAVGVCPRVPLLALASLAVPLAVALALRPPPVLRPDPVAPLLRLPLLPALLPPRPPDRLSFRPPLRDAMTRSPFEPTVDWHFIITPVGRGK